MRYRVNNLSIQRVHEINKNNEATNKTLCWRLEHTVNKTSKYGQWILKIHSIFLITKCEKKRICK